MESQLVHFLLGTYNTLNLSVLDLSHLWLIGWDKSIPFFGVIGFHPWQNLKEVCVVVACKAAKLIFPLGVSHTSDLVYSRLNVPSIIELIIFLVVVQSYLEVAGNLNAVHNSKDYVEIRRCYSFWLSLLLFALLLEKQRDFIVFEVCFAELP